MRWCLILLVAAGCSSKSPEVDLTVVAGASMSSDAVASIRLLGFAVTGVETAYRNYPIAAFPSDRQERVIYQPRATTGSITISVDALDAANNNIGHGDGVVSLGGGQVALTIPLNGAGDDGGSVDDGGMPLDLTPPPDFAGACGGAADGTVCGSPDPCYDAPTCIAGVCTAHQAADGTSCGRADSCHMAPTCVAGTCTPHPLTDGTACGAADSCHSAPTCIAGACTPHALADGTVCAPTNAICNNAGTCKAGVCGPITHKAAGVVCAPAINACHTNGVCDGNGNCGAEGTHPNGFSYDGVYNHRCCGGNPVDTDRDPNNCSVCGYRCGAGLACAPSHGGVYCDCAGANANCVETQFCSLGSVYWGGPPDICASASCQGNANYCNAAFPGSHCREGMNGATITGPLYCAY